MVSLVRICAATTFLCLAACSRQDSPGSREAFGKGAPLVQTSIVEEVPAHGPDDTLAYEHTVAVELSPGLVANRMTEIRATCTSRHELSCVVLDVSFQSELSVPNGTLRLRMAPAAVEQVIAIAAKDGRVTSRNTHAEDLAGPVRDTERELSQLTAQRDRLTEFTNRKGLPVDQLITVSKELASVQAQIDTLNTRKASLHRRIDTELLMINLSSPKEAYAAEQTPILDAVRSFGTDFKDAIAQVIRFIAVLLPWLVVIIPGLIVVRLLWRWTTRRSHVNQNQ